MNKDFVVIKFGSELVTSEEGINQGAIDHYAYGLSELYKEEKIIVVTSGAVRAGEAREKNKGRDIGSYDNVTLAQLGSMSIMHAWESAFDKVGVSAGSLLVTHNEIEDLSEGPLFIQALNLAGDKEVASIVNANDALSNRELMEFLKCSDNDGLALHIAVAVGAKVLKIFTKKGGIYDDDGNFISVVDRSNIHDIQKMLNIREKSSSKTGPGTGGMAKKNEAAWNGALAGINSSISAVSDDMRGDLTTTFAAV